MTQNLMLRQGDVLIVPVPEIPISESARAVMVPRGPRGVVLQEGTATGHAHAIASRSAELFELDGVRYLRTAEPVELGHEEHKTHCAVCVEWTIAVRRLAAGFEQSAYRCAAHDVIGQTVILGEPGATAIPAGEFRILPHSEYVPGELPRRVED